MYRKLLIVIACFGIIGCASNNSIPITPDVANTLRNREITTATRSKPSFSARTTGKAFFGLVGAVLAGVAGNEVVAKYNIDDPAVYIGNKLSTALSTQYGTKISSNTIAVTDNDVQTLSRKNAGVDLFLDIKTVIWGVNHCMPDMNKYFVTYKAELRLIDIKGGKVLAEGVCNNVEYQFPPAAKPTSPTYEELLDNDAARLKAEIGEVADSCVLEFKAKALQL